MTNEMIERFRERFVKTNKIPMFMYGKNIPKEIQEFIQSELDLAVAEERKKIVEMIRKVTDYDHSKCPIKETCIGYQNCVSDIENGVISLINKTQ